MELFEAGHPSMHVYEIGKPIPGMRNQPPYQERAIYAWQGGQHWLQIFFNRPNQAEIRAVQRGPAEFALTVDGPVIFFLYHIPNLAHWSDAPYTWHLTHLAPDRTPPRELEPTEHALLTIHLIDARSGILKAMRVVSFSPEFSQELHRQIRAQMEQPFDRHAYMSHIDRIYVTTSPTQLLERAIVSCKAGD